MTVVTCSNGIVEQWEDMGAVWDHTFRDVLQIDPGSGMRIMLTEAPMNPKANRQRMLEVRSKKACVSGWLAGWLAGWLGSGCGRMHAD